MALADDAVFDLEQAVVLTAELKTQPVEKTHPRDGLNRSFHISHAVERPVIEYGSDHIGVIALNPVDEFVIRCRKSFR